METFFSKYFRAIRGNQTEYQGVRGKYRFRTQNPAGLPPHVGSIPTSGTNDFDNFAFSVLDFVRVGL